jgi:hypothetical protein
MVISSAGKVSITPDLAVVLTLAEVTRQVWKSASGNCPVGPVGASAIHSALELAQPPETAQVWVVLKLLAVLVASVTLSA